MLPLGDIQYDSSTTARINAVYAPTWGRVKSISRPILGNHEGGSGSGYFDYFNGVGAADGPAGPRGKGYYSYDLGAWHLVALNSNCSAVSCSAGSEQETWLRADLAAHPANCTLAYWHHPRWSSGHDGSNDFMQPLWEALQDAHAEVLLSGHSHDYERFAPLDRDGEVDQAEGIRQFVVGTGGAFFTGGLGTLEPHSEIAQNDTFGVLKLTLHHASYDWEFVPDAGGGVHRFRFAGLPRPGRSPAGSAAPPGWHRPGDLEAPARATPGPAKEHVPVPALGGGHGHVHDQAQGQESLSHGGQVHPVRRRGREREALPRQDPQQAPAPGDVQGRCCAPAMRPGTAPPPRASASESYGGGVDNALCGNYVRRAGPGRPRRVKLLAIWLALVVLAMSAASAAGAEPQPDAAPQAPAVSPDPAPEAAPQSTEPPASPPAATPTAPAQTQTAAPAPRPSGAQHATAAARARGQACRQGPPHAREGASGRARRRRRLGRVAWCASTRSSPAPNRQTTRPRASSSSPPEPCSRWCSRVGRWPRSRRVR